MQYRPWRIHQALTSSTISKINFYHNGNLWWSVLSCEFKKKKLNTILWLCMPKQLYDWAPCHSWNSRSISSHENSLTHKWIKYMGVLAVCPYRNVASAVWKQTHASVLGSATSSLGYEPTDDRRPKHRRFCTVQTAALRSSERGEESWRKLPVMQSASITIICV